MMQENKRPPHRRQTKSRRRIKKSDVTSSTAATKSVLITAAIDANEGGDVAVIDAPGSFLPSEMDEEVAFIF